VNGRYVLPQVVQEMMPKTAPLGHFVQISVKVAIDRTGRVTDARVVENTGEDSEALDGVATEAAREWRFHPATLGGKPVPSEYTVVFAFRPQLP
jgi:TonB family protein